MSDGLEELAPPGPPKNPHDLLADRLDQQAATIVFVRWLAGIFFSLVVVVGTVETSILWALSHNVAVLEAQMPSHETMNEIFHANQLLSQDVAKLQSTSISHVDHEVLTARIETMAQQLGIAAANQESIMHRLDALEARMWKSELKP